MSQTLEQLALALIVDRASESERHLEVGFNRLHSVDCIFICRKQPSPRQLPYGKSSSDTTSIRLRLPSADLLTQHHEFNRSACIRIIQWQLRQSAQEAKQETRLADCSGFGFQRGSECICEQWRQSERDWRTSSRPSIQRSSDSGKCIWKFISNAGAEHGCQACSACLILLRYSVYQSRCNWLGLSMQIALLYRMAIFDSNRKQYSVLARQVLVHPRLYPLAQLQQANHRAQALTEVISLERAVVCAIHHPMACS